MAKMVGFSRPIKLEWIDKVAFLVAEEKADEEVKQELHEYLSFEITSPTNLRKTREILLSIWVRCPEDIKKLALAARQNGNKNDMLAVHWAMILLAYPLFWDAASLMGKVTNLQDSFTTNWLKTKLSEIWGERDTMIESVPRITQSMRQMGILEQVKTGEFKANHYEVKNEQCIECVAAIILKIGDKGYYSIEDIANIAAMFPFEFMLTHEIVYNSKVLNVSNMGGRAVLMAE